MMITSLSLVVRVMCNLIIEGYFVSIIIVYSLRRISGDINQLVLSPEIQTIKMLISLDSGRHILTIIICYNIIM